MMGRFSPGIISLEILLQLWPGQDSNLLFSRCWRGFAIRAISLAIKVRRR